MKWRNLNKTLEDLKENEEKADKTHLINTEGVSRKRYIDIFENEKANVEKEDNTHDWSINKKKLTLKKLWIVWLCSGIDSVDYQIWFWKYSPIFLFLIWPHLGPLALFWAIRCYFFGPLRLFLGLGSDSKTILEPTYVVNQLWFWKYSLIFLLLLRPNLGPFLPFLGLWGLFLGLRSGSKTFFYF